MRPMPVIFLASHLLLLLLLAAWPIAEASVSDSRAWLKGFDNLSDYEETAVRSAHSVRLCLAEASNLTRLVTFNETSKSCREFRCRMGLPNCRKCHSTGGWGSGAANLTAVWTPKPFAEQCWITVQHRVSDSVSFNRNWTEYKAGFGEGPVGNYWIGLDQLHILTNSPTQPRKLRILMKSWNNTEYWIEYASFSVGPESTKYKLSITAEYSKSHSTIGNSMDVASGRRFSTKDENNDECSNRQYNCAARFNGWWFSCCSNVFANGVYYNYPAALSTPDWKGIAWRFPFGASYSLMEFEMLIA